MSELESVRLVETASLSFYPSVTETMRLAGARDDLFGPELVGEAARLVVAAWVMAVDGDDTTLTATAQPDAMHWLMHPIRKSWQVDRGPRVTKIEVWGLEPDAEPPQLRIKFQFAGRRRFTDPGRTEREPDGETTFHATLDLILVDAGPRRWQLSAGHVETLDEFLGYVFISRRETPEEYYKRTGSPAPPAAAGPARRFRLVAGFAEHDERLGSSATIEVHRETAPTRDEAVRLVWPAVEEETARALGAGDWRPSLNWLDVIELLDELPPVRVTVRPGRLRPGR
jgi:hypothetical protein